MISKSVVVDAAVINDNVDSDLPTTSTFGLLPTLEHEARGHRGALECGPAARSLYKRSHFLGVANRSLHGIWHEFGRETGSGATNPFLMKIGSTVTTWA